MLQFKCTFFMSETTCNASLCVAYIKKNNRTIYLDMIRQDEQFFFDSSQEDLKLFIKRCNADIINKTIIGSKDDLINPYITNVKLVDCEPENANKDKVFLVTTTIE